MRFEDAISYIGEFGKFQKIQCLLLSLPIMAVAMHALTITYIGAVPKYRCYVPGWDDYVNQTEAWKINSSLIFPVDPKTGEYSQCSIYDVNITRGMWITTPDNETAVTTCSKWVYDTSQYKSSVVMEWNMVCERQYLRNLAQSMYMAGMGVGSVVFGVLADKFGRKKIMLISQLIQIISGVALIFSPEYISFIILRFIIGASHTGILLTAFVIGIEIVGKKGKVLAAISFGVTFSFGIMLMALEGYFIREWKTLELVVAVPAVLALLSFWDKIVSKSPRWLLQNHQQDECCAILQKAAKVNGVRFSDEMLSQIQPDVKHQSSFIAMMKFPRMRRNGFIVFYNWFVVSMVYWGLSLASSEIPGGNDYLNLALSGLVELPGLLYSFILMNHFGRKPAMATSQIFTGIALLCVMLVPKDLTWLNLTLSMLGKAFSASAFMVAFQYSGELFPTIVRNSVMGVSSMCARVGGILAPFVNLIGSYSHETVPLVTFGVLSIIAGGLAILLPETRNRDMPESLQQGEEFGRKLKKIPVKD